MFGLMHVRRKYNDFLHSVAKFHIVAVREIFHANDEPNKRSKNEMSRGGIAEREKKPRERTYYRTHTKTQYENQVNRIA